MKIIGKLHDYYDGLMSYGQDESILFKRVTQTFDNTADPVVKEVSDLLKLEVFERSTWLGYYRFPSTDITTKKGNRHHVSSVFIGFCGKLYFGLHVNSYSTFGSTEHIDKYIFSVEDAEKLEQIYEYTSTHDWVEKKKIKYLSNKMEKCVEATSKVDISGFLIKHKIPYFVANTQQGSLLNVTFIPVLKDYEFQRVKDPYSAYQEISMYMGGVIPQDAMEGIIISDKDRIFQHGFNKLSFRHPIKFKRVK